MLEYFSNLSLFQFVGLFVMNYNSSLSNFLTKYFKL
jgi:hypothetical protein